MIFLMKSLSEDSNYSGDLILFQNMEKQEFLRGGMSGHEVEIFLIGVNVFFENGSQYAFLFGLKE